MTDLFLLKLLGGYAFIKIDLSLIFSNFLQNTGDCGGQ